MMDDLGLGILVSMKDQFSHNAARVESSMQSLDTTVADASARMTQHMELIQQGAMVMGAGMAAMAVPVGLVASTAATQRALGEMASLGYEDFTALERAAESFTNTYAGFSKPAIIGASYDIKSALSSLSDEAVGTFAQLAALTAKATKASTEEMVGTFTTAYGIFKPIMQDLTDMQWAETFSGALAQTVQSFKTTGAQMAEAIKNVGATAAASNIPLNEQLAILGTLQTTMPGSEAGTLYKAFIMKAAEAGEKLGLSFVGPTGQLKGILPILEEVQHAFPDLSQAAAQVKIKEAFGSDEAVKFLLQITMNAQALATGIDSVGNAMQRGTALTAQMAQAMNRDIGAQFGLIGQQTKNLTEILGATLLPLTIPILQSIQFVVLRLQDWARVHPGLTRAILATSLALGGLLVVVGGGMALIGSLGLLLPGIQAGLAALGPMLAGAVGAVGASLLPVTLIIAGVIAAVWVLYRAWQTNFGGIRDVLTNAWINIRAVFTGVLQLITSFNGATGTMSAEVAAQLQKAGLLNFVVTVFQVYARVRSFLEGLWAGFSSFFGNIRTAVEPSVTALVGAFRGLFTALGRVFGVIQSVKVQVAGTTGSWRTLGQTVGEVLGFIGQVVALVFAGVVWVITGVVQVIRGIVVALGWVREAVTVVANYFITHWRTIGTVVKWAAGILSLVFGPALVQSGIQATIAGARIVGNYLAGLQMVGSISLVRTITQLRSIASMPWSSFTGGIQGIASALRAAGLATLQYAAAGWRAVGALAAQAGQWVVLRARTLAGIAATIASRIAQIASAVATGIATAATWAFNAALWANPITWIIAAIVGLIAVVILLWKNWSTVSAWLTGAWQSIKNAATAVFGWLAGFFRKWGLTILAVITGPVGLIALAIYKHWDRITGFLAGVWGWMKQAGGAIWDGVKAGAATVAGWATKAWDEMKTGASRTWDGIKSGVSSYVNFQRGNLQLAVGIASSTWNAIANGHGSLWDRCKHAAGQAVQQISAKYPVLGTAMQAVGNTINNVWQSIRGAASKTWLAISGWATNAWTTVTSASRQAWKTICDGLSSLASSALEAGKRMMQTLADGIKSAALAPFNALKSALGKLGQLLPHSDAELGPLSTLSVSGFSLLDTLSRGIEQASALPAQALQRAFAFGEHLATMLPPTLAPATAGAPPLRPITPVTVRPVIPAATTPSASEPVRDLLELIASKLEALAHQPAGDTVVQLDGREIARAVYKDMRQQRIRGYENWG